MRLRDYLTSEGLSYGRFAARIGVANGSVVMRYANGRLPRQKAIMEAIKRETGGLVTANDFYGSSEGGAVLTLPPTGSAAAHD